MNGVYLDGDYTVRTQDGPWIVSRDPETRARLFKRTMRQIKDLYVQMIPSALNHISITIGEQASITAYFYEETQPRDTGAGVVEFDEFYAEVPGSYTEPQPITYTYQWLMGILTIRDSTRPITGKAVHSFGIVDYDGTTDLTIRVAPRYLDLTHTIGDFSAYSTTPGEFTLAQDTIIRRWHGPIFEKTEIWAPALPYTITT